MGFELNRQKTEKPTSLNIWCLRATPSVTKNPPDRVVMTPLSCRGFASGVCPGGVKSKQKSGNFEKKGVFCLQMSSSSFIYTRSEQCDLLPIYTITNTQRIRIYSCKLKSFLIKFHLIQDINMVNMPKKTKLYSRFLMLRIYPDSPVHSTANTERIQICLVMM